MKILQSSIPPIQLADPVFHLPADVDILLGCNEDNEIQLGQTIQTLDGPVMHHTKFGWTFSGTVHSPQPIAAAAQTKATYSHVCTVNSNVLPQHGIKSDADKSQIIKQATKGLKTSITLRQEISRGSGNCRKPGDRNNNNKGKSFPTLEKPQATENREPPHSQLEKLQPLEKQQLQKSSSSKKARSLQDMSSCAIVASKKSPKTSSKEASKQQTRFHRHSTPEIDRFPSVVPDHQHRQDRRFTTVYFYRRHQPINEATYNRICDLSTFKTESYRRFTTVQAGSYTG